MGANVPIDMQALWVVVEVEPGDVPNDLRWTFANTALGRNADRDRGMHLVQVRANIRPEA